MNTLTITRFKENEDEKHYATIHPFDEREWPAGLPGDVADLIRSGETKNNQMHSEDGYWYRINSL